MGGGKADRKYFIYLHGNIQIRTDGGVLMEQPTKQVKTGGAGKGVGSTSPKGIRSIINKVFFNAHREDGFLFLRKSGNDVSKEMLDILLKTTDLLDDPVLKDNKNVIIIVARDIKSLGECVCTGEDGEAVLKRLRTIANGNYPSEVKETAMDAVQKIRRRI